MSVFLYTVALPIALLVEALLLMGMAAFYVFHAARQVPSRIVWIVLLLCAPPLAVPAYWWAAIWRAPEVP